MTKHLSLLREIAKFLSGMVAADMIIGIWMLASQSPSFFGIAFTIPFLCAWLVVDVALLLVLIHYAWRVHLPGRHPRRVFLYSTGWIFAVLAAIHFLLIVFGVPLVVGPIIIPYWSNVFGTVITGFLSYIGFAFARRSNS